MRSTPGSGDSKTETAYEVLRARIRDGTYGPGNRLVIDRIARELEISNLPVREAIRRLEAEGYVLLERHVGARVASIEPERYVDVLKTLAILEGAATALAAPLLGAADLRAAAEFNVAIAAALEDFDPILSRESNQAFHRTLYIRCPNQSLLAMIEQLDVQVASFRHSTFDFVPERAREAVREHEHLLGLISGHRPPEEIESYARRHRTETAEAFEQRTVRPAAGSEPKAPRGSARSRR